MIKQSGCRFSWHLFPTTWLSLLLLVLLFPMGLSLPAWWGRENGPLENIQILILIIGLVVSCFAARHSRDNQNARSLWLWLTLFWLLGIGRELSWGRVFFPVASGTNELISLHQLWYGPLVEPVIAVVTIAMVIGIYLNSPLKYIRQTTLPLSDIAILLLSVILASVYDKNMVPLFHSQKQMLEEWAELTAYWSLISIVMVTCFAKPAKLSLQEVKRISIIHRL